MHSKIDQQGPEWSSRRQRSEDGLGSLVCRLVRSLFREGLELKAIAPTLILAGQVQVRNQFYDFRPRHSPAEFAKFLASDTEKLARVIRTVCQSEQLVSMANPGPKWPTPIGTAGPLDRVAQIAEHKYCRPEARPFRLGFPRKVPVFPICPPAAR